MASGKLQEAEKHIAEAKKCLRTGLLKWNPDYHSAANHFEKAAVCYRTSRDYDRALDAYKQAHQAYYDNNAIYHAGKMLEQAAHVAREIKHFSEAATLMNRASNYYHESGHPDTAGQVLNKIGVMLQHEDPPLAAKYFQMTSDFLSLDEKPREAANAMKNALRMHCRARDMDKVVEVARLSRETFVNAGMINLAHEAICVEVIALLLQGRGMQSLEILEESQSVQDFATSEDYSVLMDLVNAVTENDEEARRKYCDHGVFKAMDPEFAKLLRDLKTGAKAAKVKPVSRQPNTGGGATQGATGGGTARENLKGPIRNPNQLSDMRSQLFATSKEKTKKTRVETSPSSSPTKPIDPPVPEEPHSSPSLEGSQDHLPEPHEQPLRDDDVSDEDEPLDIN